MSSTGPDAAPDFTIEQDWQGYGEEQHAVWRLLFERQQKLLVGRACREYLDGLGALGVAARGIPDFRGLSEVLDRATGWRIVAVPGLVPDAVFFAHLARRRFPSTCFIRRRDQLDYLQEPDIFHDICGHVPLLVNPVFADYLQAYGEGGLKAQSLGHLQRLARLYWYTVEFGLLSTPAGLRIYGSGILSSAGEFGLLPRRSACPSPGLQSAPGDAHALSHRPVSGHLFRYQRFRAAVRRDAARFRPDLPRTRGVARP